ncbi:hypothetical protein MYX76_01160 [Desulfobacterota bacterium AH_259_B03_O07]|nr:hypothetical protein [Desulfobacterota bacterium AH_259_B03_O07]
MTDSNLKAALQQEVKLMLEVVGKQAEELGLQIEQLRQKHDEVAKRFKVIKDFYQLQFGNLVTKSNKDSENLFEVKSLFKDLTIREACRTVLSHSGPLHVSSIQHILKQGGRYVEKTSLTSTMLRAKEFERVEGKQNTFKLKDEGVTNVVESKMGRE